MHVATGRTLSTQELIDYLSAFRVVYAGETHDSVEDHKVQLEIIKGLFKKFPRKIAIGFEMLQRPSQPDVDAFINGKLSKKEFLKVWSKNWHGMYDYYEDIIGFARENNIKILALNAEDDLRKIFRDTEIEKIDEETKKRLPEMDFEDPHYNAFIAAVFGGHGKGEGSLKYVEMFKKMQTLWDETMAETAAKYLQSPEGEGKRLIVISGGGHVQFGLESQGGFSGGFRFLMSQSNLFLLRLPRKRQTTPLK
ncbi:MAG: ChaN family lipoprotein [Nitrospinota bacterium]